MTFQTADSTEFVIPSQATIPAGQTCTTITIVIVDDLIVEPQGDSVTLTISNPPNILLIDPTANTFTLNVIDNGKIFGHNS